MSQDNEEEALVGNAADAKQVRQAGGTVKRREQREKNDLKFVLSEPQGRRVLWRLMEFCGVNATVIGESDARTNFNAGKQDVGHFILATITKADEEMLFQMMREAQKETD